MGKTRVLSVFLLCISFLFIAEGASAANKVAVSTNSSQGNLVAQNNIWEVIVVQDNVPYYEEKSTSSRMLGKLNAGDKIKLFGATAFFMTTEIDGEIRYIETRYVDLSSSTMDKDLIESIWKTMRDEGIMPPVKYKNDAGYINPMKPDETNKPTSSEKAANSSIWEVTVIQDNVPYYEEKDKKSKVAGQLNAGDRIKMYSAAAHFLTTEIDGEIRYVETRFVDLLSSTRNIQEIEAIWASMRDAGIMPPGKYKGEEDSTASKKMDEPKKEASSDKKDTVKFVYLEEDRASRYDPYSILAIDYKTIAMTKLYATPSSKGKVLTTVDANETLKVSDTNMKFVAANRKKVNEWLEVVYYGQKLYVKRADIITNYEVYISPKAKTWNYNYRHSNGIVTDSYPSYDSGSLVTVNDIPHDPIYDLLNVGTTVMPSAITNSSVIKPKAGTGASTTTYIPSTGTASGDGWKAPTFSKNIYDGIFKDVFSFDLGFRNTYDHFGVVFETTDGSRLDVLALNPGSYIGGYEVKGLTKKEGYRTKEMLKLTIPFFLEKSEASQGAKVYNDFIAYTQSGLSVTKMVMYKGFKADFIKTGKDSYEIYMYR